MKISRVGRSKKEITQQFYDILDYGIVNILKIPFSLNSFIKLFDSRVFAIGWLTYKKHKYVLFRP